MTKLIKYFLASLAVPDNDQWVNLSPYEKNRIIKEDFGKTEMGRDLLAEDYMLKQITASLIYPQDKLGQEFWNKIYAKAYQQFGTTDIPVNTFNKVWIVPDDAEVFEKGNMAYCVKNHLKVMLEEDYLSLSKHSGIQTLNTASQYKTHAIGSQIVREIILPALEKEVNEGKNFASLRQVFSGAVLAAWYKRELKESFLGQVYMNKNRLKGVDQNPRNNQIIYEQYLKAFKKGVFNFIKEDVDRYSKETIPRKYFSGGTVVMDGYDGANGQEPALKVDPTPTPEESIQERSEAGDEDVANVVTDEAMNALVPYEGKGSPAQPTGLDLLKQMISPILIRIDGVPSKDIDAIQGMDSAQEILGSLAQIRERWSVANLDGVEKVSSLEFFIKYVAENLSIHKGMWEPPAPGKAVEQQERLGQEMLSGGLFLPVLGTEGQFAAQWSAMGVELGASLAFDPLFRSVILPKGWKVVFLNDLVSLVVDEHWKVRAQINFKAAWYDRFAEVQIRTERTHVYPSRLEEEAAAIKKKQKDLADKKIEIKHTQIFSQGELLPWDGTQEQESEWENMGIKLGERSKSNPLFREATLPTGWKISFYKGYSSPSYNGVSGYRRTSTLLDNMGQIRAWIGYDPRAGWAKINRGSIKTINIENFAKGYEGVAQYCKKHKIDAPVAEIAKQLEKAKGLSWDHSLFTPAEASQWPKNWFLDIRDILMKAGLILSVYHEEGQGDFSHVIRGLSSAESIDGVLAGEKPIIGFDYGKIQDTVRFGQAKLELIRGQKYPGLKGTKTSCIFTDESMGQEVEAILDGDVFLTQDLVEGRAAGASLIKIFQRLVKEGGEWRDSAMTAIVAKYQGVSFIVRPGDTADDIVAHYDLVRKAESRAPGEKNTVTIVEGNGYDTPLAKFAQQLVDTKHVDPIVANFNGVLFIVEPGDQVRRIMDDYEHMVLAEAAERRTESVSPDTKYIQPKTSAATINDFAQELIVAVSQRDRGALPGSATLTETPKTQALVLKGSAVKMHNMQRKGVLNSGEEMLLTYSKVEFPNSKAVGSLECKAGDRRVRAFDRREQYLGSAYPGRDFEREGIKVNFSDGQVFINNHVSPN